MKHERYIINDEEIEALKIKNQSLRSAANSYKLHYNEASAEAIKEFAEELKEKLELCDIVVESGNFGITIKVGYETVYVLNAIYNLIKEMVGEE